VGEPNVTGAAARAADGTQRNAATSVKPNHILTCAYELEAI
jgi:hypothetical protein